MIAGLFPRILRHFLALTALSASLAIAPDPSPLKAADSASSAILAVLNRQQDAWNAGNVTEFVRDYAEDCTFFGRTTVVGREAVRKRYETTYSTPESMGKLSFSALEVKPVDANVAIVLGHFHLERTAEGGGNADGIFSLVFALRGGHWQILLDHTS
jgi:uncharacterized protein (TIGR02246 family)